MLGPQRFRVGQQQISDEVGVTNGLAVTSHVDTPVAAERLDGSEVIGKLDAEVEIVGRDQRVAVATGLFAEFSGRRRRQ